ncbi:hypothetical protein Goshw_008644 [Gossypium schwendimanii]|uniref:Uncharacterized protein n=1 Tax=Gossypium schwendimanii TaxID=34291 RepID=A0A7J9MS49_GOSSC|nr:hypothetical protein [Gossypium schwendimanii]
MTKPSNYSTVTMVTFLIYSMSRWISMCFELWLYIEISFTVALLLESLQDLILAHPNTKKKVDVFALSIYRLVIFPKALGHINDAVLDLFDRLDKRVMPFRQFG